MQKTRSEKVMKTMLEYGFSGVVKHDESCSCLGAVHTFIKRADLRKLQKAIPKTP
jgi:hypothetical protein